MEAISYTLARSELSKMMEKVCNDHSPIIVTRQNAESIVMISLDDYNAMEETAYLLKSPKNAARLAQSIQELEQGQIIKKEDL